MISFTGSIPLPTWNVPEAVADWLGTDVVDGSLLNWSVRYSAYSALTNEAMRLLNSGAYDNLVATGHSMGGALAEKFMDEHGSDTRISTVAFASPGIRSSERFGDRIINVDHLEDQVVNAILGDDVLGQDLEISRLGASDELLEHPPERYYDSLTKIFGTLEGAGFNPSFFSEYLASNIEKYSFFVGRETSDEYFGSDLAEAIFVSDGSDNVYGGGGNDLIDGGDGPDDLRGESGNDQVYGGASFDFLYGGEGDDSLYGGESYDYLYGEAGGDSLIGGAGNDYLYGGDQFLEEITKDSLLGGDGDDHLFGQKGDDLIDGGVGEDTAYFELLENAYSFSISRLQGPGETGIRVEQQHLGSSSPLTDMNGSATMYRVETINIKEVGVFSTKDISSRERVVFVDHNFSENDAKETGEHDRYWIKAGNLFSFSAVQTLYEEVPSSNAGPSSLAVRRTDTGEIFEFISDLSFVSFSEGEVQSVDSAFAPSNGTATTTIQPGPADGVDLSVTSVFWTDSNYAKDNEILRSGGWADWYHSLLRFDLPDIAGDVLSAEIQLYIAETSDTRFSRDQIELYRILGDWDETLGFYSEDRPSVQYLDTLPAPTAEEGWYVIDATTLVQGWAEGATPNFGIQLQTVGNNAKLNDFYSSDYSIAELRPKLVISYANESSQPEVLTKVSSDFDGDGIDDILFFNESTRTVGQFGMPDATWSGIGNAGTSWEARGIGLFDNSDTSADILWFNTQTRAVGRFDMVGGVRDSWKGIGQAGVGWEVKGAGDFNSDGVDDILWFNDSTNSVGQFRLDGTGAASWVGIGSTGIEWEIAGIGDFNGDRYDDVLWINESTGALGQFRMSESGRAWVGVTGLGNGFDVAGTGDFNGDGIDDILVFNSSTQALGQFDMDTGTADWISLGTAGSGWSIEGIGDFNGNGTDDILWRHTDGRIGQYQMDGDTFSWDAIGVAGTAWDVVL